MSDVSGSDPKLEKSWLDQLSPEFDAPYMRELKQFLLREKAAGKTIYPAGSNIFAALNRTPFHGVRRS